MDYQAALQKATSDMREAESKLVAFGFSQDQWIEIKAYIQAAILRFQLTYAKALTEVVDRQSA